MLQVKFVKVGKGSLHLASESGSTRCSNGYWFNRLRREGMAVLDLVLTSGELLQLDIDWEYVQNYHLLRIGKERVCSDCTRLLLQDLEREEEKMALDTSKPIIYRHDGGHAQAAGNTVAAAKALAKSITEDEGVAATVMVPHTTYKRTAPPVKEIKHKKTS